MDDYLPSEYEAYNDELEYGEGNLLELVYPAQHTLTYIENITLKAAKQYVKDLRKKDKEQFSAVHYDENWKETKL